MPSKQAGRKRTGRWTAIAIGAALVAGSAIGGAYWHYYVPHTVGLGAALADDDGADVARWLRRDPSALSRPRDSSGHPPLVWAVIHNKPHALDALLAFDAPLHATAPDVAPALHFCRLWQPGIIAQLLDAGADPNLRDAGGRTALQAIIDNSIYSNATWRDESAFARKYSASVVALLNAGADVNAIDTQGATPLHAVATFHISMHTAISGRSSTMDAQPNAEAEVRLNALVAQMLIDHGAHVDELDHTGRTPLHRALEANALALADVLFAAGADLDRQAVLSRRVESDESAAHFRYSDDRFAGPTSALHREIAHGPSFSGDMAVGWLINHGADVEARVTLEGPEGVVQLTPLELARRVENRTAVDLLTARGATERRSR